MELIASLNSYLGWTSLVFYVLIIVATNMKMIRKLAYVSVINDILYGLSMGINGVAKVVINLSVGAINSNRYAKDFTNLPKNIIRGLTVLAFLGTGYILYFGLNDLINDFQWFKVALWIDAALVIGALMVKNIYLYRTLILFSCGPAIIGYGAIGETPMIIIKCIVAIIATFHLFRTHITGKE